MYDIVLDYDLGFIDGINNVEVNEKNSIFEISME